MENNVLEMKCCLRKIRHWERTSGQPWPKRTYDENISNINELSSLVSNALPNPCVFLLHRRSAGCGVSADAR